jgi:hypothetical protein
MFRGGDHGGARGGTRRGWRLGARAAAAGVVLVASAVVPTSRRHVHVTEPPPVTSDVAALVESLVLRVTLWTGEGRRVVVLPPSRWALAGQPLSVALLDGGSLDLAVERGADGVVSVCLRPTARLRTARVEVVLRRGVDETCSAVASASIGSTWQGRWWIRGPRTVGCGARLRRRATRPRRSFCRAGATGCWWTPRRGSGSTSAPRSGTSWCFASTTGRPSSGSCPGRRQRR